MNDHFEVDAENVKIKVVGNGPIVVVDDDPLQHEIIQVCYQKAHRDEPLILLYSGEELLKLLDEVRAGEKVVPSLVLLDINMPSLNGHDVLKKIRSCDDFKTIPVIVMLTASNFSKDKEEAFKNGADGYFSKPTDVNKYISFFRDI